MVRRRVGMSRGWLLGEEPGSVNERCLHSGQAAGKEKARHAHYGTGLHDDIVVLAALAVPTIIVCDGSIARFFLTHLDDAVEYDRLDNQVQAWSLTGSYITVSQEYRSHLLFNAWICLHDITEGNYIST